MHATSVRCDHRRVDRALCAVDPYGSRSHRVQLYVWTALVLCACACELAEGECAQVHFIPNWTLADSQIVGPSYLAGFYLSLYIGRS